MAERIAHDAIVVGAGMVGACAAAALGRLGLRVALLGASAHTGWDPDRVDVRVSAISPGSERVFRCIDAWPGMAARRVSPYRRMQVWSDSGSIAFDALEIGEPRLGYIIENSLVTGSLLDAAADAGVELVIPARVGAIHPGAESVRVVTAAHGDFRARLLVAADGATSSVREALAIPVRVRPYHQRALVATVATAGNHDQTAWQRFLPGGPLAFLPLSDGRCSIVWSCDDPLARELLALDDDTFRANLADAFEHRLGAVLECGKRHAFSLMARHAGTYIATRTALIGDAAHVVHPLAGLGANLGFADAAALADVVSAAADQGRDIGSPRVLRAYERWRRSENDAVLRLLSACKAVFGSRWSWLRQAGGVGLQAGAAFGPLKHALMRRATGLAGDLPRLARP